MREYNDTGVCAICRKPVVDGEPIYGITGNHYDCERPVSDADLLKMSDRIIKSADEALAKLKRGLK